MKSKEKIDLTDDKIYKNIIYINITKKNDDFIITKRTYKKKK